MRRRVCPLHSQTTIGYIPVLIQHRNETYMLTWTDQSRSARVEWGRTHIRGCQNKDPFDYVTMKSAATARSGQVLIVLLKIGDLPHWEPNRRRGWSEADIFRRCGSKEARQAVLRREQVPHKDETTPNQPHMPLQLRSLVEFLKQGSSITYLPDRQGSMKITRDPSYVTGISLLMPLC